MICIVFNKESNKNGTFALLVIVIVLKSIHSKVRHKQDWDFIFLLPQAAVLPGFVSTVVDCVQKPSKPYALCGALICGAHLGHGLWFT